MLFSAKQNTPGRLSDSLILFIRAIENASDAICIFGRSNSQVSRSATFRCFNDIHQWATRAKLDSEIELLQLKYRNGDERIISGVTDLCATVINPAAMHSTTPMPKCSFHIVCKPIDAI